MKALFAVSMAALAALATSPAVAQDNEGKIQIKVLGTGVLPDGKITSVNTDIVGLPADTQTKANDNYVPTIAIEYFFNDNLSIETICCMTQHDVDAVSGLPGAELVSNAKLIPATLTAKYHFDLNGVKPYVGAGPAYFLWISDKPGAATVPLGVTDTDLSDEFGLALQVGFDVPINGEGFGLTVDAKRYFIDTTARWYAGDTLAIETDHKIDPWVVSAGVSYRF
ncbi:OmpW family outer membrane protein [Altererythrobacter sp.]|uniref:OmpW/AlkL family protein n=1 Tax=Altererythrobacter sp. TaxID=1872480 RepID=UPI001B1A2951|nr:OmpW family outer membrane protein [Altererythrobacter sp.]MBO6609533.1 OmpW family protein [Altererythrobacter sp.]MBO6641852.1 OmpW family protein [Altererythrobacter sp.]MBO6709760.1 OmpW family protein [Altererythrobacter sp.]